MFHARFPGSLIDNLFTNNGVFQTASACRAPTRPSWPPARFSECPFQPAPRKHFGGTNIQFGAPHRGLPTPSRARWRSSVRSDRDTAVTVSYIWSRGLQVLGSAISISGVPTRMSPTRLRTPAATRRARSVPRFTLLHRVDPRYGGIKGPERGEQLLQRPRRLGPQTHRTRLSGAAVVYVVSRHRLRPGGRRRRALLLQPTSYYLRTAISGSTREAPDSISGIGSSSPSSGSRSSAIATVRCGSTSSTTGSSEHHDSGQRTSHYRANSHHRRCRGRNC